MSRLAPDAIVRPIVDCLAALAQAKEQVHQQSTVNKGRFVTPARLLYAGIGLFAAIVLVEVANRSSNVRLETSVTARPAAAGLETTVTAPPAAAPPPIAKMAENASGAIPSLQNQVRNERPDFSKVDYSYDFSTDDITPPSGRKLETRFKKLGASDTRRTGKFGEFLEGCWASEEDMLPKTALSLYMAIELCGTTKESIRKKLRAAG